MSYMCLDILGKEFFCFPVRDWEVVCGKLLPVVKLYRGFCV